MNTSFIASLLEHGRVWRSFGRCLLARATGAEIGPSCRLGLGCDLVLGFSNARRGTLRLGVGCVLERGVVIHPYGGSVILGEHVFLGPSCVIYGHGHVVIGSNSLLSMQCRVLSSNHSVPSPGTLIRSQPDIPLATNIGKDVWLGAGVTILGGVTIGDGCVVGAGAVVTHDLPPNSIAAGVPARIIGSRS